MAEFIESETHRQRFIRNGTESIGIMRSQAVEARREGREDDAQRIDRMADDWKRLQEKAESEESES